MNMGVIGTMINDGIYEDERLSPEANEAIVSAVEKETARKIVNSMIKWRLTGTYIISPAVVQKIAEIYEVN